MLGLSGICEYMLELDLPTAAYNDEGISVIDHIITKLPTEMATEALNQFIVVDKQSRRRKSYLSCLTKRRWRMLTSNTDCHSSYDPPTPLEVSQLLLLFNSLSYEELISSRDHNL